MNDALSLDLFDFELPPERIAQNPADRRDAARLLCLSRSVTGAALRHGRMTDLPSLLAPGDLLVMNATRVLPARLRGRKASGGSAEALLLGTCDDAARSFRALLRTSGRQKLDMQLAFGPEHDLRTARVAAIHERGEVTLSFDSDRSPYEVGEAPLPPYIERKGIPDAAQRRLDLDRYQTIFARVDGAVAAPTAGLHLTPELFTALEARGIATAQVVLHVGLGTFRPISDDDVRAQRLHSEAFELPQSTVEGIAAARARGGRVIAVGTTTTRVLESCAQNHSPLVAATGTTDLFIQPGHEFRVIDGLLTNFHLPRSSLLYLVAALVGRERLLDAYAVAIAENYRFFSYGDAMLII